MMRTSNEVGVAAQIGEQHDTQRMPEPHVDADRGKQHHARNVRVLFVIDQLTVLGGGERAMIQMILGLSSRFECSVVAFRQNAHSEVSALLDVPVTAIPLRRTCSAKGLIAAFELGRTIRREHVDIVHTFFETSDLFGGIIAKLAGVKVLISSRRDMGLLRSGKHKLAYRLVGHMCNRVITVSDAVRHQVLTSDHLNPERVTTLYTGVRPHERVSQDVLLALRNRLGIPFGAPVVLTVANILTWKGHHDFLEAASIVRSRIPAAHYVVCGAYNDVELVKALESRRAALGMNGCFHYVGEVRLVGPMYQLASVFCLLSRTEGLPNVVLEAMAAGTPVIATCVGGTSELIAHGKTGLLVEPDSPRDAAARICELLSSPQCAKRIAEAARYRVMNDFTMEKMIQSLEEIYDASLAE